MAMISCPECQSDVSDAALKCPSCGVQLRIPKRTFFGKLVKYSFILFNLIMAYWIFAGLGGASEQYSELSSEAEKAGAAIGTGLGVMFIAGIWFVGDVILGLFVLFTRPKS